MSGLNRLEAVTLATRGWPFPRVEAVSEWLVALGWMNPHLRTVREEEGIATFCYPDGRALVIHRNLTYLDAASAWSHLPSGALVEAWTDGSGVTTDVAVGCASVMRCEAAAGKDGVRIGGADVRHRIGRGTNNIAEILGIQLALACCPRTDLQLVVHTDSMYSIGSLTPSMGWKARANSQLIRQVCNHLILRPAALKHVKGHAGDPHNELADRLAGQARLKE